ncbi:MAG: hypothetical protein RR053_07095, partial [Evtepia sp.]
MKNKLVICMTLGAIAIPVTAEKTGTYNKNNIPGVLQMEDYDYGGEGVAYHNNSPGNEGGAYRSDDVDLYSSAQGYTMGA